jgi:hypothetical protein
MQAADLTELKRAVDLLENPSWVAMVANIIGVPIEWSIKKLPKRANKIISAAVNKSLLAALKAAVLTMDRSRPYAATKWWHRLAVIVSGGAGGFFSLPGLAIELPISTTLMLRSIACIARSEGEDLRVRESQLACVQVFALGGTRSADDASDSGYYAVRIALARALSEAAEFIAEKGVIEEGAPVIVRLIARIAARFEVIVSEKVAAEAIPVVGAVSGAAVNLAFITHFQQMARGHFIVRKLERKYGGDEVKKQYARLLSK